MRIQQDKILHFLAGFFICTVASLLISLWLGLILSFAAGIGKEIYDLKIKKTFYSWPDMLATIIGGLIAILVMYCSYFIK